VLENRFLRPGDKVVLGETANRVCRFCGKTSPAVTFKPEAHAIPELLGNKSITATYECDACNQFFGSGIENDLGNWSKPLRSFARIRGKSGVPTLKKGGPNPGWRIEYEETGFKVTSYENEPLFEIDEANKKITFELKRDSYTPVAVLKALVKIGLTLMPETEIGNFVHSLAWIQNPDHSLVLPSELLLSIPSNRAPCPMTCSPCSSCAESRR
jgi:HNH endonuclease